MNGQSEHDFMTMMIPHHQGAIDIAKAVFLYSNDPEIRNLALGVPDHYSGVERRSFAVVASEVRSLTQRSATAAKDIKVLIDNSVQEVGAGSQLVNQAGKTMDDVVSSIQKVSAMLKEISSSQNPSNPA